MPIAQEKLINSAKQMKLRIIKFFLDNPNPTDEQVHTLAAQYSMTPEALEKLIYELFTQFIDIFNFSNSTPTNVEYSEQADLHKPDINQDNVDIFIDAFYDRLIKLNPNIKYEVKHGNPTVITVNGDNLTFYYHKVLDDIAKFSNIRADHFSVSRRGNNYVVTINYT